MSGVRIAVAGAGLIGRHHVRLIQKSGSCRPSAIVDPAPGAADFAREAGVPIFPSLTDLFATKRPDGVIVATPNSLHVKNGMECVDHADPLARQLEHFCSVIRGTSHPLVTGRDAVQTLRATLAIHEAAQTGRPVHLPPAEKTAATTDKESR